VFSPGPTKGGMHGRIDDSTGLSFGNDIPYIRHRLP
jgi:hypothetical protein